MQEDEYDDITQTVVWFTDTGNDGVVIERKQTHLLQLRLKEHLL